MWSEIERFIEGLKAKGYSAKSLKGYRERLLSLSRHLEGKSVSRLQDVTLETLELYRLELVDRGLSAWTIDAYLRAAKGLFAQMERQGVVFMNPAEGLHLQKVKGRMQRIPSIEDMDKLLSMPDVSTSIGLRDRAMLETAYSTACRLSELAHLKLDDVNLAAASIIIRQGKGAKDRVAPLGRHAVKWLGFYLEKARPALLCDKEDQRHLWLNANGIGLSAEGVHWLFKHHSEDAKISPCVTIHSVRRLVATSMLQNGAHPAMIAEMLGHATLKTLGAYLRVTLKDLKDMQSKVEAGR
jgi:integrase/recombinase XerD